MEVHIYSLDNLAGYGTPNLLTMKYLNKLILRYTDSIFPSRRILVKWSFCLAFVSAKAIRLGNILFSTGRTLSRGHQLLYSPRMHMLASFIDVILPFLYSSCLYMHVPSLFWLFLLHRQHATHACSLINQIGHHTFNCLPSSKQSLCCTQHLHAFMRLYGLCLYILVTICMHAQPFSLPATSCGYTPLADNLHNSNYIGFVKIRCQHRPLSFGVWKTHALKLYKSGASICSITSWTWDLSFSYVALS